MQSLGDTPVTARKELDFFFDYSSPFAYLGATQVEALAARNGAALRYRPFLLGGLFREIGTPDVPLLAMPEPKRRHSVRDMARWADFYGVPFHFPTRFPMVTVKALRITIALPEDERRKIIGPLFQAFWVDDRDISDDAVLASVLADAGLDPEIWLTKTKDDSIKVALREATDEARRLGVCGAPTYLVDGLLFFGQDRQIFVEKALNGWRPKGEEKEGGT
jgi:2-hydroxychromene-2-carboxylate isomerase